MSFICNEEVDIFDDIYSNLSTKKKIDIFLSLHNACVEDSLKISRKYIKYSSNMDEIFTNATFDLLKVKPLKNLKCVNFCLVSNAIIHAFLQGKELPKFANEPTMALAKFIRTFYKSGYFDFQMMFEEYVFDKIKRRHLNKDVYVKDGVIILSSGGIQLLGVIPIFKKFNSNYKNNLLNKLNFAMQKYKKFSYLDLYVVFPRHEKFTKFIEIKNYFGTEASLKLVPYKICNIIYNKGII